MGAGARVRDGSGRARHGITPRIGRRRDRGAAGGRIWRGYWWFEDAYATAMSVAALSDGDGTAAGEAIDGACSWAIQRLARERNPSPFALSLLISILLRSEGPRALCDEAATSLVAQQADDGSWRGTARLRIPRPDVTDPSRVDGWERWWGAGSPFNIYSVDQACIFTTATAYAALQLLSRTAGRDVALR